MTLGLRGAVTGLLNFACAEEQALVLAFGPGSDGGSPDRWAAVPLVAHNTDFKNQQAERIVALRSGQVPPSFGEIDHGSAALYARYCAQPTASVVAECRRVTAALIDGTWALPDEDPTRTWWSTRPVILTSLPSGRFNGSGLVAALR